MLTTRLLSASTTTSAATATTSTTTTTATSLPAAVAKSATVAYLSPAAADGMERNGHRCWWIVLLVLILGLVLLIVLAFVLTIVLTARDDSPTDSPFLSEPPSPVSSPVPVPASGSVPSGSSTWQVPLFSLNRRRSGKRCVIQADKKIPKRSSNNIYERAEDKRWLPLA